jgi:DNA-binding NarL/FixJ family response regulator
MSPHFWIGAQVFLDLLMVALLLWFLRAFSRRDGSFREHEQAVTRAEAILAEMREIGRVLEANLNEKKELSSRILTQLDQALKQADESCGRISAILPEIGRGLSPAPTEPRDPEKTRTSIYALLAKGLQKEEIARHLGISQGEIELMMKLWPPERP